MKRIVWYPFIADDDGERGPFLNGGPMFYADIELPEEEIVRGLTESLNGDEFRVPLRRVQEFWKESKHMARQVAERRRK